MNSRCFEGLIFGPPDRIIRLGHTLHNRPGGLSKGGKTI